MVGPISGGSGSPNIPGIPDTPGEAGDPNFVDTQVTAPTGQTFNVAFLAKTPSMSTLKLLKIVSEARVEDAAEQFKALAQRGELRKMDYFANADFVLSGIQRAQAINTQITLQLVVAGLLDGFFDDVEADVNNLNAFIGPSPAPGPDSQYELTEDLNNAALAWNQAKANYQNTPNPANAAALTTATNDYQAARDTYEFIRPFVNISQNSYNAIVQPKQDILDTPNGINDLRAETNALRALLGYDPILPERYDLVTPLMAEAFPVPDISDLNNLPADLSTFSLPTQIDITVPDINDIINELIGSINIIVNLVSNSSELNFSLATQSADEFDYLFFILQEKPNPTVLQAFIESRPSYTAAEIGTGGDVAQPGASAINANLTATPGNLFLSSAVTQAIYNAQIQDQRAPLSEGERDVILSRITADVNGVASAQLRNIKLNAAIETRDTLGPNLAPKDPAVRAVSGINTVTALQELINSGRLEQLVNQSIQGSVGNNPEVGDALRTPLLAAVKAQLQFIASNELAEAVGNPNIGAQVLLATPGLEQLQGLLAGSAVSQDADILRAPFAEAFVTVTIADRIALGGDTSPGEAITEAEGILQDLLQQGVLTPEELRKALLEALQKIGLEGQQKVIDAILGGIDRTQNPATLNQRINADRIQRDLIISQVTADTIEQEAINRAFEQGVLTAQDLLASVQASLINSGVAADRANAVANQTARITLLQSSVLEGLDNRLKQLPPDQRKFIEEEFLSTIHIPQKTKIEAKEEQLNPLSIPSQIAQVLDDLAGRGETGTIGAIEESAKRSARETSGDLKQHRRHQDLGLIYLHQTTEAGSPFVGTDALPKTNASKPAAAFDKIEIRG